MIIGNEIVVMDVTTVETGVYDVTMPCLLLLILTTDWTNNAAGYGVIDFGRGIIVVNTNYEE